MNESLLEGIKLQIQSNLPQALAGEFKAFYDQANLWKQELEKASQEVDRLKKELSAEKDSYHKLMSVKTDLETRTRTWDELNKLKEELRVEKSDLDLTKERTLRFAAENSRQDIMTLAQAVFRNPTFVTRKIGDVPIMQQHSDGSRYSSSVAVDHTERKTVE